MRQNGVEPQQSEKTSTEQHPHNCLNGGVYHNYREIALQWDTSTDNWPKEVLDLSIPVLRQGELYEKINIWKPAGQRSIRNIIKEVWSLCRIPHVQPKLVEAIDLMKKAHRMMAQATKLIEQEHKEIRNRRAGD